MNSWTLEVEVNLRDQGQADLFVSYALSEYVTVMTFELMEENKYEGQKFSVQL